MPPPPPLASPVGDGDLAFTDDLVVSPRKRRPKRASGGWSRGLLVLLVVAGSFGGVLYAFREELSDLLGEDSAQTKATRKAGNFAFRPASGWRRDAELQEKMRANLALSLKKPRSHMALFYTDHQTRAYTDAQLLDRGLRQLRAFFPHLEYQDPFVGAENGRTDSLGGEPAVVFTFSATDAEKVPMRGQAYLLSRRGFAYWLYFWGPEDDYDQLAEGWELLRQGFRLHDDREGWKPPPRETATFVGTGLSYQLRYAKDTWKAEDDPRGEDELCDLLLRGYEVEEDDRGNRKRSEKLVAKSATISVLTLPKAADLKAATAAALEHVKEQQKKLNEGLKVDLLPATKSAPTLGEFRGQIDRARLVLASDNERFLFLAVANRPEGVLAIACECRMDRRDYWEQEFKAVVESLRASSRAAAPRPKPKDAEKPEKMPPEDS